ncbi:hypothetical protein MBEHAL_1080 [Halarchaeum acidiphilum MH1-52-1]|uniref:Uncharacterized protein n=1 Tax=Halarchaeum acidiphilum MH1-52-1 TaxID=1261545 RepID=U2YTK5_9EURY|nr:hypothetical protein [Halarchaeum acidiphilum]GAD52320.1 hypothetical protein MBEHAL_1080 [Halarchaeum acidiphilum MH1-52-1]
MTLPAPVAFARRCFAALVRRPAAALDPFLDESYPDEPTLSEEWLTIATGAGSLALVALGATVAVALSALYALLYALARGVGRLGSRARARIGR